MQIGGVDWGQSTKRGLRTAVTEWILDGPDALSGHPADFAVGEADFLPFAHGVQQIYLHPFVEDEEIGTLVIGSALDGNGGRENYRGAVASFLFSLLNEAGDAEDAADHRDQRE